MGGARVGGRGRSEEEFGFEEDAPREKKNVVFFSTHSEVFPLHHVEEANMLDLPQNRGFLDKSAKVEESAIPSHLIFSHLISSSPPLPCPPFLSL